MDQATRTPGKGSGRAAAVSWVRLLLELTKFRIASFSTLSAVTGHVLAAEGLRWGVLSASLGTLLVALGACAANEWQDRELDLRMPRTRSRPIPSGRLRPGAAVAIAVFLAAAGLMLLLLAHGPVPAAIALFALAWYNAFYTYLKRAWAFAVVPGALIGAAPPAIGWTAAGGDAFAPAILSVCFFFFLWQVPHFWLLLFLHGREYEEAGLPAATSVLSTVQLGRLTLLWTVTTVGSSLLLHLFGALPSTPLALGLVPAGAAVVLAMARLLRPGTSRGTFGLAFAGINLYALAVMALLVLDALW